LLSREYNKIQLNKTAIIPHEPDISVLKIKKIQRNSGFLKRIRPTTTSVFCSDFIRKRKIFVKHEMEKNGQI